MTNTVQNEYHPDYVTPLGDTLLETLEAIGMPQSELAKRMNRPVKTINEIMQAKTAITAETAQQLEQILRIPASFWLNRERRYRESLARLAKDQCLEGWVEWLSQIPIEEMMRSYRSKASIEEFAKEVGIAPGIVVGRLQHENLLPENDCNDLKCHLEWA